MNLPKPSVPERVTKIINKWSSLSLEKKRRLLQAVSGVCLLISMAFPIWGLDFVLQNGADEVFMRVYFNKITGNIQSLITLSGYFGVHLPFDSLNFPIEAIRPTVGVTTGGISYSGDIPLFTELKLFKVMIPVTAAITILSAALKAKRGRVLTYISSFLFYAVFLVGLLFLKIRNSDVYIMKEESAFIHPSMNPYINPGLWGKVDYYTATVSTRPYLGGFLIGFGLLFTTMALLYSFGYNPVERMLGLKPTYRRTVIKHD